MEEQFNEPIHPINPRRKIRSKMQIFKENYLPLIIAGIAIILIIIFIIGSIVRAVQRRDAEKAALYNASSAATAERARLEEAANKLIANAKSLMANYEYESAINLLNSFEGDISEFPAINDVILECEAAQRDMVTWTDPNQIPNLSFQLLVADPARGFNRGSMINQKFVTTEEFSKILQQLYDNGYILVNMDDFIITETNAAGNVVYKYKPLVLPKGKKPVMITQTNVNYNYYLIDSNDDKIPDAGGAGIASKLLWDGNTFSCEMVDANGKTVTGDFDLIPILEKFISAHPDFSYRGARATIALTGYNGLFGYRTHPDTVDSYDRNTEIEGAKKVATALKNAGYTLAYYTYDNSRSYMDSSLTKIKSDLMKWSDEVESIVGEFDTIVYAQDEDISEEKEYSGDKFNLLYENGFHYYIGFADSGSSWTTITDTYIHQGRIMVCGATMYHNANWFDGMFDSVSVLDPTRGNIPTY